MSRKNIADALLMSFAIVGTYLIVFESNPPILKNIGMFLLGLAIIFSINRPLFYILLRRLKL